MATEATVGYLVWRLSTKWRAAVDRTVGPFRLTHAQYSLLASLYGMSRDGRRPSQRELAEHTGLEPIFVSKLARALERSGLLERAEHPADSRAVQLTLTPRGAEAVVEAIAAVQALLGELTKPLGGVRSKRTRELTEMLRTLLEGDHQ